MNSQLKDKPTAALDNCPMCNSNSVVFEATKFYCTTCGANTMTVFSPDDSLPPEVTKALVAQVWNAWVLGFVFPTGERPEFLYCKETKWSVRFVTDVWYTNVESVLECMNLVCLTLVYATTPKAEGDLRARIEKERVCGESPDSPESLQLVQEKEKRLQEWMSYIRNMQGVW